MKDLTDTLFVKFAVTDDRGSYMPAVALEVRSVTWYGMSETGMLWDITHTDHTRERITVSAAKYGDFTVGDATDRIVSIEIRTFAHPVLTKDEFRARFGTGKLMHPGRGHFVPADQMPAESE